MTKTLGVSYNPKWDVKRQLIVPRKASDMAMAILPLLKNCRTAIFIDPYFMTKDPSKWKRPFFEFVQILSTARCELRKFRIEIHSSKGYKTAPSAEYFRKLCHDTLSDGIPEGLSVCFKRWEQKRGGEKLHDRYLITDIGGVDFSIGLDEGEDGETQKISLLEQHAYKAVWERYMSKDPAFVLHEGETFTIIGNKR